MVAASLKTGTMTPRQGTFGGSGVRLDAGELMRGEVKALGDGFNGKLQRPISNTSFFPPGFASFWPGTSTL
jgi:hypothetical protein